MKTKKFRCWNSELNDYIYFSNGRYYSFSEESPSDHYCEMLFNWDDAEQLDYTNNPIFTRNYEEVMA